MGEPGFGQEPRLDHRVQGLAGQPRPVRGPAVRQHGRRRRGPRHGCEAWKRRRR